MQGEGPLLQFVVVGSPLFVPPICEAKGLTLNPYREKLLLLSNQA